MVATCCLSGGSFLELCATPCNEQITSKIAHILATSVKGLSIKDILRQMHFLKLTCDTMNPHPITEPHVRHGPQECLVCESN